MAKVYKMTGDVEEMDREHPLCPVTQVQPMKSDCQLMWKSKKPSHNIVVFSHTYL